MHLTISGHHIEITESLRLYVSAKLQKLERHFDAIASMTVILSVEKHSQKAESTVNIPGGEIYADAEQHDLYAAIDHLVVKLNRQLSRKKERLKTRHNKNKAKDF